MRSAVTSVLSNLALCLRGHRRRVFLRYQNIADRPGNTVRKTEIAGRVSSALLFGTTAVPVNQGIETTGAAITGVRNPSPAC